MPGQSVCFYPPINHADHFSKFTTSKLSKSTHSKSSPLTLPDVIFDIIIIPFLTPQDITRIMCVSTNVHSWYTSPTLPISSTITNMPPTSHPTILQQPSTWSTPNARGMRMWETMCRVMYGITWNHGWCVYEKQQEQHDTEDKMESTSSIPSYFTLFYQLHTSRSLFISNPNEWESHILTLLNTTTTSSLAMTVISRFCYHHTSHLPRGMLSEFLCVYPRDGAMYRREYLHAYARLFTWYIHTSTSTHMMSFDWALRLFIAIMWLPASSKAIDRVFHAFSCAYVEQQAQWMNEHGNDMVVSEPSVPGGPTPTVTSLPILTPATAYILCFSLVMLSTDHHHPQVKDKMSCEAWMSNHTLTMNYMKEKNSKKYGDEKSISTLTTTSSSSSTDEQNDTELTLTSSLLRSYYHTIQYAPIVWKLMAQSHHGWISMRSQHHPNPFDPYAPTSSIHMSISSVFTWLQPKRRVWMNVCDGVLTMSTDETKKHVIEVITLDGQHASIVPVAQPVGLPTAVSSTSSTEKKTKSTSISSTTPQCNYECGCARTIIPTHISMNMDAHHSFDLQHHDRMYTFYPASAEERDIWMPVLRWNIFAKQHGMDRFRHLIPQ